MIELGTAHDVLGSTVTIDLPGLAATPGGIIWQCGPYVGVRFDDPVREAVVRHVGFTPPPTAFEERRHRGRTGRVLPPLDAGQRRYG